MNDGKPVQLHPAVEQGKRLDEHARYIGQLQEDSIARNFDVVKLRAEVAEIQKHFRESGFIYVASPYSGTFNEMENRYQQVMWYVIGLLKNRQWCYSPVLHCHELAKLHGLPTDAQYWMNYNFAMLAAARELHVFCIDGWKNSVGVSAETAFWRQHSERPVKFIEP